MRRPLLSALAVLAVAGSAAAAPPKPPAIVCVLPPGKTSLPAGARRGLINHLRQYPEVSLATPRQRDAARALLRRIEQSVRRWPTPNAATRAGFGTKTQRRERGDRTVHYLHAEHRAWSADSRFLDPLRPESLIYANAPGRPLVLVGVMFSVPRGVAGATPGGPITRWHSHVVCVAGLKRGLKPRTDGSCPPGASLRQGSEMLHVWFTGDLRSAFAVHAPEPELCKAGLLPVGHCRSGTVGRGM